MGLTFEYCESFGEISLLALLGTTQTIDRRRKTLNIRRNLHGHRTRSMANKFPNFQLVIKSDIPTHCQDPIVAPRNVERNCIAISSSDNQSAEARLICCDRETHPPRPHY